MQRHGRWVLTAAALLAFGPATARGQAVRPKICVSVDLSDRGVQHVRDKLVAESKDRHPEHLVAEAAVRSLSLLRTFEFTDRCLGKAPPIHLRLIFTSERHGWPYSELKLAAQLELGASLPRRVALGT